MFRTTALLMLVLFSVPALTAEDADTVETRREAAQRYLAVSDFPKLLDSALEAGVQSAPAQSRAEVLALLKKHLRYDTLEGLALAAMVKNFTTQELDALARFYGSAEGRSAMAKFGAYVADILPVVQAEMVHATDAIKAELDARKASSSGT